MENLRSPEKAKQDKIVATCEALLSGDDKDQERRIIENLKMYRDTGRGYRTSIFHENIPESEKQVALQGEVYEKMWRIQEVTKETKKEIAFVTFGHEMNGVYSIDYIFSDLDIPMDVKEAYYKRNPDARANDSAADFSLILQYKAGNILDWKKSCKSPIIGTGHSHPDVTESYGNYSLADLNSFDSHKDFITQPRETDESNNNFTFIHTILPANGDVDIMTFNDDKKRYEKVTKVFDLKENIAVSNYTFESPTKLAETTIEKEADEDENDMVFSEAIDDFLFKHRFDI